MKKSIFPFITIAVFVIWFSSCRKCVQHQIADLKFTPKDLSINPYTGNEILIFKNLNGDSIVLSKGVRKLERYTRYQYDNETAKLDHHGCQGDYFTADEDRSGFNTNPDDSITSFLINLNYLYTLDNPNSDKIIWLLFHQGNNNSGFWGNFRFNDDSLFNYPAKIDSIVAFHNQINIGPKSFTNVYELYGHNEDTRNPEWFSTAFYSVTDGFCGVKSNFGQIWYLFKKVQ